MADYLAPVPAAPVEPTEEQIKEMLGRFARKSHNACWGRGYVIRNKAIVPCHCAEQRMRAAVEAHGKP